MKKKRIDNVLVLLVFMLIMVALGISDSNRGVFSSIFEQMQFLTPKISTGFFKINSGEHEIIISSGDFTSS